MNKKLTFAHLVQAFMHTDRFDCCIRSTITLALCITIPLSLILIAFMVSILRPNEISLNSTQWFSRVVKVNPDRFLNIQHHFVDGIDYSHQFRFSYDREDDIKAIIVAHRMNRCFLRNGMWSKSTPEWYDLGERNGVVRSYCAEDSFESSSLFVDDKRQVAYFEFIHF